MKEYIEKAEPNDFFSLQASLNEYFKKHEDIGGEKKWRRAEWFLEPRLYPSGKYENISSKTLYAYNKYLKDHPENKSRSPHGSWSFLGPNDFNGGGGMGRVNSIDFHPTNDAIIYLTTPNGGIWKTINGGINWSNKTPQLPLLSFADLEIDYTNPNVIYALTGDGDPNPGFLFEHGQHDVASTGILKSTDGGDTWVQTNFSFYNGPPAPLVPIKLLMHPTNPQIQFVASQSGIYKTEDGWISADTVYESLVYDLEFKPGDPSIMYMSSKDSIFRSLDTGESFFPVTDPDFSIMAGATRVELAVTPDFPNLVYAMAGDWDNGSIAFYASYLDGNSNTWGVKDVSTDIIGAFADYCIGMTVDPEDYTIVFAGGVDSWRSDNEGSTGSWTKVNQGVVHADVHDMAFRNGAIYIASDGGIFKSTDNGDSWEDLSKGLHITEIYRISGTTDDPELYFMGTQDNGTYRRTSGSTFDHVLGNDGMTNIIDYANINIIYASTQNGDLNKSSDGGDSFTWLQDPGNGAWITPYILDPENHIRIFSGQDTIYRSGLGGAMGSWEKIGGSAPTGFNVLAQGIDNNNRMYASDISQIFRSDNVLAAASSVSWNNVSSGLPNLFITDIVVDPTSSLNVFITLSGYNDGMKVYKSTNGGTGASWENISGSLPNVPINCIAFHEDGSGLDRLYVGTDIGVFYMDNSIGDWIYFSNFLPSVPVTDLYVNPVAGTITAGTYGRGLWRSDLVSNCLNSVVFSSSIVQGGEIHYSYNDFIESQAKISTNPGSAIFYQAGNLIDLKPGFFVPNTALFEGRIGPCPN